MPKSKIQNRKHIAHLQVVRRQTLAIRYVSIAIVTLVVVLAGYALLAPTIKMQIGSVAKVNGESIKVAEFQKQVKFNRLQLMNRYQQTVQLYQAFGMDPTTDPNVSGQLQQILTQLDPSGKEALGQSVIDQMVDDLLIRQAAAKEGITVSAEEVDTELQNAFGYFPDGTPTTAPTITPFVLPELNATQLALVTITPTPSTIPTSTEAPTSTPDVNVTATQAPTATATLGPTATSTTGPSPTPQPTATPITFEGYQTQVADWVTNNGKETGYTDADMRLLVENSLYRKKMLEFVTKDMKPVQEQVWARHILVADAAAAQAIYERLQNGEDFAALAAEFSTDTSNKDKGGDLGWFGEGKMVVEFQTAAFALKVGEISQPVKSSFGYHIIQALGHEDRPLDQQTFEQMKQDTFTKWLADQRTASDVKIDDFWKDIVPTTPEFKTTQ